MKSIPDNHLISAILMSFVCLGGAMKADEEGFPKLVLFFLVVLCLVVLITVCEALT